MTNYPPFSDQIISSTYRTELSQCDRVSPPTTATATLKALLEWNSFRGNVFRNHDDFPLIPCDWKVSVCCLSHFIGNNKNSSFFLSLFLSHSVKHSLSLSDGVWLEASFFFFVFPNFPTRLEANMRVRWKSGKKERRKNGLSEGRLDDIEEKQEKFLIFMIYYGEKFIISMGNVKGKTKTERKIA